MIQYLVEEAAMAAIDLHEAALAIDAAEQAEQRAVTDKSLDRARAQLGG